MTVRGTRHLFGREAAELQGTIQRLGDLAGTYGYVPFIPSALASAELFDGQMGDNRTYEFKDRSDRKLVLIPEVTAIAREEYRKDWSKTLKKPVRIWYGTRCYRYDRPQHGRWREFWQFGIECMGGEADDVVAILQDCMDEVNLKVEVMTGVKRGLGYYVEDGFEVWAGGLQIAGGGRYEEGIGFAIGIDRLILASQEKGSAKAK